MSVWKIHSSLLFTLIIVMLIAFKPSDSTERKFANIEIEGSLCTAVLIQDYLQIYVGDSLDSAINIGMLEEKLILHPAVEEAEVYSSLNGEVHLRVQLTKPLARMLGASSDKYITEDASFLSSEVDGSSRTPIVYGDLDEKELEELKWMIKQVESDDFWKHQITAYERTEEDWLLHVRKGSHYIRLSNRNEVMADLKKLNVIYDSVLTKKGWDYYREFDLRYKDQVVCLKQ